MITRRLTPHRSTFDLRPNGSLGWRQAQRVCVALLLLSTLVSGYFAALGAWLVLPFAGAEMALVAVALYLSCRWSCQGERISVDRDSVQVERRRAECHRFQRAWARVVVVRDPRGWYPSRVYLRSHGRALEIGSRLVEEERLELAAELGRLTGGSAAFDHALTVTSPAPTPRSVAT